ncbi:hypothetical protein C8Q80DRAFT_1117796 [Daedaleopsis nitida]|nr:hypothetical protein C8Q80DRAFT_1117796 [Daedaleopsis nitida]
MSWCNRCRTTWYCTPEHLNGDWPVHEAACAPFQLLALYRSWYQLHQPTFSPESYTLRRAVGYIFLPGEARSFPVRIPYRLGIRNPNPNTPRALPDLRALFAASSCTRAPSEFVLRTNIFSSGRPLLRPLSVWYCASYTDAAGAPFPVNRAILSLSADPAAWGLPVLGPGLTGTFDSNTTGAGVGTVDGTTGSWKSTGWGRWALQCGPIVVLKYEDRNLHAGFSDVRREDLVHFLAYLLGHTV